MSSKLEELKKLREQLNITVNGLDNYSKDDVSLFVSNHNCLMDIFYLPMSIPDSMASLISARLMYKNEPERKELVNKYLYAMPIEAHGGSSYSNICLKHAEKLLLSGINLSIFPEGAYVLDESIVYRGRTGVARILFNAKKNGMNVKLVPVSINIKNKIKDMDSFKTKDDIVEINILDSINYDEDYRMFFETDDVQIKNNALHNVVDNALGEISKFLGKVYSRDYIELFPKGNVIFEDGTLVPTIDAKKDIYIEKYDRDLSSYTDNLSKKFVKDNSLNKY